MVERDEAILVKVDNEWIKMNAKLLEQVCGENFADAAVTGMQMLADIENIRDDDPEEQEEMKKDLVRAAMWSMSFEWLEAEIKQMKGE